MAPIEAPIRISWWMLAVAFALTEIFVAHIRYREDAQTYSLSEVPLLVGLCFATPTGLVVGRLLGALVALTLHRRQSGVKLAFNLGLFLVLDACLAPLIFHALLQAHLPLHPVGWAAAYATLMITDTLSGLAIVLVTLLHQGSVPASAVRSDLVFGLLVATVNVSFGLVTVTTLWYNPPALLLLLVVTAIMVAAYRGYVSLGSLYERLQKLFAFTCSSGDMSSGLGSSSLALEKLREAVKAGYVELTLFAEGDAALRWVLDDGTEPEATSQVQVSSPERELLCTPSIDQATDLAPQLRMDIRRRGLTQIMVAPLKDRECFIGSVLVGSRSGVRAFGQTDLPTLQTLANHLAVTLKNARLMERLRAEAEEREHQALHDPLTDLPNRRAFLAAIDEALLEHSVSGGGFALVLLDLAGFRQVNDTLGHEAGDKALIELSSRFRDLDHVIIASRLGGDEFSFLAHSPDGGAALDLGAQLRDVVSRPVPLGSFTVQLRANVGVVLCPVHGESGELLLQRADMALQAAKEGPQGLALFRDEHDTSSPRRLTLAGDLDRAVAEGRIEVAYQPQVDLMSGRVVGIEALARWCHQRLGKISPEEFIPIAESTGAIWRLTRRVLRRALEDAGPWLRDDDGLRLSLNLSVRCLYYSELPDVLEAALRHASVERQRLVLELTESSLMTDFARFQQAVDDLVAAGFAVSIDDFGVGYSSLAYIRSLHAAEVKIDRAFVADLLHSSETRAIVKSVVDLAHAVHARVIAEGVEDRSTLQRLQTMACDAAQGFYVSRPLTAEALRVWLPENAESTGEGWSGVAANACRTTGPVQLRPASSRPA